MGNEKITLDMSMKDIVIAMSEFNPGAYHILIKMIDAPKSFMDILLCDTLGIRVSKLYMIHNDCCGRNRRSSSIW